MIYRNIVFIVVLKSIYGHSIFKWIVIHLQYAFRYVSA
jgi:hypothetical protein